MIVSSSICAASSNFDDRSSRESVAGPQRRLLDDNIIDKEILSAYSQLATQQCNFTTPLSTLLTAKSQVTPAPSVYELELPVSALTLWKILLPKKM
eukprot:scaffold3737_cov117-Skeletonema_dohrnii-CCMP3373.AAC.2